MGHSSPFPRPPRNAIELATVVEFRFMFTKKKSCGCYCMSTGGLWGLSSVLFRGCWRLGKPIQENKKTRLGGIKRLGPAVWRECL